MSRYFLLLLGLAACVRTYTALEAHKDSCVADGFAIKDESEAEGQPCLVTQARLQRHVQTNPDCLAYWGDGGVNLQCGASDAGH